MQRPVRKALYLLTVAALPPVAPARAQIEAEPFHAIALATNPGSSELAAPALVRSIENRRSALCLQECWITRHTQPVDRAYCVILI
jgi:hypothetical protein